MAVESRDSAGAPPGDSEGEHRERGAGLAVVDPGRLSLVIEPAAVEGLAVIADVNAARFLRPVPADTLILRAPALGPAVQRTLLLGADAQRAPLEPPRLICTTVLSSLRRFRLRRAPPEGGCLGERRSWLWAEVLHPHPSEISIPYPVSRELLGASGAASFLNLISQDDTRQPVGLDRRPVGRVFSLARALHRG